MGQDNRRKSPEVERVLARLRQLFAALPQITEGVDGHGHTTFRVGTKTLAMLGEYEGLASLSMKSDLSTQAELLKRKDFSATPYVGQHGWVSTGGTVNDIDWDVVQMIVTATFRRVAPKRLLADLQ
jgi:predicted DNA-binding protein (MmcQ/YjbR family)